MRAAQAEMKEGGRKVEVVIRGGLVGGAEGGERVSREAEGSDVVENGVRRKRGGGASGGMAVYRGTVPRGAMAAGCGAWVMQDSR